MANAYRYGFNGQEKDDEVYGAGNLNTAEFWEYDTRLWRRWNVDPVMKPWESPYSCFGGNSVYYNDPSGANKDDRDAKRDAKQLKDETNGKMTTFKDSYNKKHFIVTPSNEWLAKHQTGTGYLDDNGAEILPNTYEFVSGDYKGNEDNLKVIGGGSKLNHYDWWDVESWGYRMESSAKSSRISGVTLSVGGATGHGAVGSQGLSLTITGKEVGLFYNSGGGAGSEGMWLSVSASVIVQTKNAVNYYNSIPIKDFSGNGRSANIAVSAFKFASVGGAYSDNKNINDSKSPITYRTYGPQLGIGVPGTSTPLSGSVQVTYSKPLITFKLPYD